MIFVLKWESIKKVNSRVLKQPVRQSDDGCFAHRFSCIIFLDVVDLSYTVPIACFFMKFWIFQCLSKNFAVDIGGTVIKLLWSVVLSGCNVVVCTRWSLQKNWRLFEYVLCDCRPLKATKEWTSNVSFNPRKWVTQRTMAY